MKLINTIKKMAFVKVMMLSSVALLILSAGIYNFYHNYPRSADFEKDFIKDRLKEFYVSHWPVIPDQIDLNHTQQAKIDQIISSMSIEQKIGQMIMVDSDYDIIQLLENYLGSVSLKPDDRARRGVKTEKILSQSDLLYIETRETTSLNGLPFIPPFNCINLSTGNYFDSKAIMFPTSVGVLKDIDLTNQMGVALYEQLALTGINCIFGYSANFSEDPYSNLIHNTSLINGLLVNNNLLVNAGGWSNHITDFNDDVFFYSVKMIQAASEGALITHIYGDDFLENSGIELLRNTMNYQGLFVTNQYALNHIKGCWVGQCDQLFNSGVDIIKFASEKNVDVEVFIANTLQSINDKKIDVNNIDDAVRRIITVKMHLGLFDLDLPSDNVNEIEKHGRVLNKHQNLANQIVEQSAVLLKNNENVLPLKRNGKYLITGDALKYSTIQFDQMHNDNTAGFKRAFNQYSKNSTIVDPLFLDSQSVIEILMNHHYSSKMKIIKELRLSPLSMSLTVPEDEQRKLDESNKLNSTDVRYHFSSFEWEVFIEQYNHKIRNYASEFDGLIYIMNASNDYGWQENRGGNSQLLTALADLDIDVIVIYLATNPEFMPSIMNQSDGFVMAWKPGSQVEPLMNLLFRDEQGNVKADFTGKLSKTWPMTNCDINNFYGSSKLNSTLPFGYGLSVHDANPRWIKLDESVIDCAGNR